MAQPFKKKIVKSLHGILLTDLKVKNKMWFLSPPGSCHRCNKPCAPGVQVQQYSRAALRLSCWLAGSFLVFFIFILKK